MEKYRIVAEVYADSEDDLRNGNFKVETLESFYSVAGGKYARVRAVLKKYTERANSWIAEDTGVSMQTVAKLRKELEDSGEISMLTFFNRRDGRITPRLYIAFHR